MMTRLHHAALMSSAAAQIVLDTDGRLTLANNRAMHLFGLTSRDAGRPIQDLEVSYRPVELRTHIETARAQRRPVWVGDVTQVRGVGETMSFDIQVVPLAEESGTEVGLTVIFHDATRYRQLREELQSTAEELRSMNDELQLSNHALRDRQDAVERLRRFVAALGSTSPGVIVVDGDLQILMWNGRAEDLWGVRPNEAVGKHLINLDVGLPVEMLQQPIRAQLAAGDPDPGELVLDAVDRHGRTVQVRVTFTCIRDLGDMARATVLVMEVVGRPE